MAKRKDGTQFVSEAQGKASAAWKAKQQAKADRIEERYVARSMLSPSEQLQVLDQRLGVGVGAIKERARLSRLIPGEANVTTVAEGSSEIPRDQAPAS